MIDSHYNMITKASKSYWRREAVRCCPHHSVFRYIEHHGTNGKCCVEDVCRSCQTFIGLYALDGSNNRFKIKVKRILGGAELLPDNTWKHQTELDYHSRIHR